MFLNIFLVIFLGIDFLSQCVKKLPYNLQAQNTIYCGLFYPGNTIYGIKILKSNKYAFVCNLGGGVVLYNRPKGQGHKA